MRRVIWAVLAVSGLWAGYWFAGATALERAARNWLVTNADAGQVQAAGADVAGFPNRFDLTLTELQVGDPGQVVWQAPFLQLFALSYKPWHLIAAFPPVQTLHLPGGAVLEMTADKLQASLVVTPTRDVALDRIVIAGDGLGLQGGGAALLALDVLQFGTRRDPSRTDTHAVGVAMTGLRPGPGVLTAQSGDALPKGDASLQLDGFLGFSAPLDRFAGETRPQPVLVELQSLRVVWGDILVEAKGRLSPDASGFAEGQIDLVLSGWDSALAVAVAAGAMPEGVAATWAELARRLAETSSTPGRIELPLTLERGRMRLGPLPLGPAPRLVP